MQGKGGRDCEQLTEAGVTELLNDQYHSEEIVFSITNSANSC